MNEIESICPECNRTDDCICDAGINPIISEADFDAFFPPAEPTNTWECQDCGETCARFRGMGDVICECGALYNAGGQRLRDDAPTFGVGGYWGPTPYDDDDY